MPITRRLSSRLDAGSEIAGVTGGDGFVSAAAAGQQDESQQMLAEIYDGFTEGFDTQARQEAQALLKSLR
jgi:hypothetical protein